MVTKQRSVVKTEHGFMNFTSSSSRKQGYNKLKHKVRATMQLNLPFMPVQTHRHLNNCQNSYSTEQFENYEAHCCENMRDCTKYESMWRTLLCNDQRLISKRTRKIKHGLYFVHNTCVLQILRFTTKLNKSDLVLCHIGTRELLNDFDQTPNWRQELAPVVSQYS